MEAYSSFAQVYDLFMDNVPYEEWSRYLIGLLREYHVLNKTVVELGCGTGKMTRLLADAGYDMVGVDNSAEMLEIAGERQEEENRDDILYLLQDMRELELFGTIQAFVSVCDSMNYILEPEDLKKVFGLVREYLVQGGIFMFDMNTVHKYRDVMGECTISENREEGSFIWDNYFYADEMVNEYDLTLFIREENDLYRKYEEIHYQKAYDLEQVKELLRQAGMECVAAYDAFTHEPVRPDSERMYIIAKRMESGN